MNPETEPTTFGTTPVPAQKAHAESYTQPVAPVQPQPVQELPQQPAQKSFEVKPAGAWSRFWANMIDSFVLILPTILIAFAWSLITQNNITLGNISNNPVFIVIFLLTYFPYYIHLTAAKGTTVGKDAYGLKVFKYGTEQNLTYVQSAIRELVKFGLMFFPIIGGLFYLVNGFTILFSKQKRGIHDRVAKSQVLRVKPAWRMVKQILFFGVYALLIIIIILLRPQFFEEKPARTDSIIEIEQSTENLTLFKDDTLGWSISYDASKFSRPFVIDKEQLQRGALTPLETTLQNAGFLVKSDVPDFCTARGGIGINVEENSQKLNIENWFEQYPKNWAYGKISSQTKLGENNAYYAILDDFTGAGDTKYTYIIANDNQIYLLTYNISKEEKQEFPASECSVNQKAIENMFSTLKLEKPVATTTPVTSSADTSNWVTYTDDKFFYSLKHPSNFVSGVTLENEGGRIVSFQKFATASDPGLAKIEVYSSNQSLDEQYQDLSKNQMFEKTTLSGHEGYKANLSVGSLKGTSYLIGNSERSHLITTTVLLGDEQDFAEVFNQILSTFEFTN